MSRTYIVTVHVTGPDDRAALLAATEVAEHLDDHYRHNTVRVDVAPQIRAADGLVAAPGEGVSSSGSALQRNPDLVRRREREQAFDEGVSFGRGSERLRIRAGIEQQRVTHTYHDYHIGVNKGLDVALRVVDEGAARTPSRDAHKGGADAAQPRASTPKPAPSKSDRGAA